MQIYQSCLTANAALPTGLDPVGPGLVLRTIDPVELAGIDDQEDAPDPGNVSSVLV